MIKTALEDAGAAADVIDADGAVTVLPDQFESGLQKLALGFARGFQDKVNILTDQSSARGIMQNGFIFEKFKGARAKDAMDAMAVNQCGPSRWGG